MSIEIIEKNIVKEQQLVQQASQLYSELTEADANRQKLILNSIGDLLSQVKILNNALPELINSVSFYRQLSNRKEAPKAVVNVRYESSIAPKEDVKKETEVAIKKEDEMKFLENLASYESSIKKIRAELASGEKAKKAEEKIKERKQSFNSYVNISNRTFRNISDSLINKGYFNSLKQDLRKITSPLIVQSYISVMFFSSLMMLFVGLLFSILFVLLKIASISVGIVIFILVPLVTLLVFYLYPSSKRKSLEKEINQELPFVTIFMAAIATSGIEPTKIFAILVASKDYPFIQREIKKLLNYINFYGYDLVSALKLMSRTCPSERLVQLFDGLSTTITSGGELAAFLNKHSESLLFDYRLEREKYTHVAETFMNIYISVVIAAPMIMMMLFILMSMIRMGPGALGPTTIGVLTVLVITLLNVGFLVFLNMKQPKF